jgi:hypothetical protein
MIVVHMDYNSVVELHMDFHLVVVDNLLPVVVVDKKVRVDIVYFLVVRLVSSSFLLLEKKNKK